MDGGSSERGATDGASRMVRKHTVNINDKTYSSLSERTCRDSPLPPAPALRHPYPQSRFHHLLQQVVDVVETLLGHGGKRDQNILGIGAETGAHLLYVVRKL